MLIDLSPSHIMALLSIVADTVARPGHVEVHVDVVRNTETTPEELLVLLMEINDNRRGGARQRSDDYLSTADVWQVLDLIAMEFLSDPQSVQCFDLRLVTRAIELARSRPQ